VLACTYTVTIFRTITYIYIWNRYSKSIANVILPTYTYWNHDLKIFCVL